MVTSAMDFFKKRFNAQEHLQKVTWAGYMISDILCRADPAHFGVKQRLRGQSKSSAGRFHQPCHVGTVCLLQLKDSIIDVIYSSTDPISPKQGSSFHGGKRDLYRCTSRNEEINMNDSVERRIWNKSSDEITQEILSVRGVHKDETPVKSWSCCGRRLCVDVAAFTMDERIRF
jgi:hypothetical protein